METPVETRAETPLVLPGESLAKYRGAPRAAPAEHSAVEPAAGLRAAAAATEAEEDLDVQTEQRVYEEPIHYPPENALPDAPAHSAPDGSLASSDPRPTATSQPPPPLPEEAVSLQEAADLEDAAQSGPVTAPMLDEDEDLRYPGDDPGRSDRGGSGTARKPEKRRRTKPKPEGEARKKDLPPPGGADATAAEPASGTAEVREQGGRFPHRVSRRSRRRGGRGPRIGRIVADRVTQRRVRPRDRARGNRADPGPKATVPTAASACYRRKCSRFPSPTF